MTVYNTAYDTTACRNYQMQKAVHAIQQAYIMEFVPSADSVMFVENSKGAMSIVPAFKHALYVSKFDSSDLRHSNEMRLQPFLAMDVRTCGSVDKITGKFKVTNSTMYKHTVYRAGLTSLWLSQGANAFRAHLPVATGLFATWIAETLAFQYNLDPKAKIDLMVLAGIFYASNHVEGLEFDKAIESRVMAQINTALKGYATFEQVEQVYAVTKVITSVDDFCNKAKEYLGNVRLENLNAGTLVTYMGGTWAGSDRFELTAVALEHPPTWLALIHEAYSNTAIRKVGLSKICERRQFQDGLKNLDSAMRHMVPDSYEYMTARTNQI